MMRARPGRRPAHRHRALVGTAAGRACARWWRASPAPGASYLPGFGYVAVATLAAWYLDRTFRASDLGMIFLARRVHGGGAAGPAPGAAGGRPGVPGLQLPLPRAALFVRHRLADRHPDPVRVPGRGAGHRRLAGRVRDQQQATSRRAAAITALLAASRRLSASAKKHDAATALAEQLSAATGGKAMILLPRRRRDRPPPPPRRRWTRSRTQDMAAARWAWEHGEAAGAGTGTLPHAGWTFWPLQGISARAGVAATEPRGQRRRRGRALRALAARPGRHRPGAGRARRRGVRGRRPAPLGAAAHGAAELHQPRPAHAAGRRAGRGDHPARVRPGAGARRSRPTCWRASATRPSGSTATSATCST